MYNKSYIFIVFLFIILSISFTSAVDISACGTLSGSTSYTLTQNVSSAGTCFTLGGNSITLDCNGYWINYDSSATGYGIYGATRTYATIKNCIINEVTTQSSGYGIYLTGASNYFNINNTIVITKGTSAYGFYTTGASYGVINNSYISTVAPPSVFFSNVRQNTIENTNLTSSRRMCLWTYGTLTTYYEHTVTNSNCEGKPILYEYNNDTAMNDWDASEFGQVLWTATNGWVCDGCTFNESGLFFGYMTNALVNDSVLNCTDATALNLYGTNTNNQFHNTEINVRGTAVSSYGIYLYNGANSNEFENVSIGITSPTSYGVYLNTVTSNTFKNFNITSNQATTYGLYVANSNSNDFNNYKLSSSATTYGLYSTGTSSTNTMKNFNISLTGTSTSNRAFYYYSGANAFTLTNGSIEVATAGARAFYFRTGTSGTTETRNVTFSDTQLTFESGSTGEVRKRFYQQFNVTDINNLPIESASLKLYSALGSLETSGLTGATGLTSLFLTTQYRRNYTSSTAYTPHSTFATKSGYDAYVNTSASYNASNFLHITLLASADDYPLPVFEDPTPSNAEILSRDWFIVNVSVKDYNWENKTQGGITIHGFSEDSGGTSEMINDGDTGSGWIDGATNNPWISLNITEDVSLKYVWVYVKPLAGVCKIEVEGSLDGENYYPLGESANWIGGAGGWYYFNATIEDEFSTYTSYKITPWTVDGVCQPVAMTDPLYEVMFETLTETGEIANCTAIIQGGGIDGDYNMTRDLLSADEGYCWINLTGAGLGNIDYYVVANDSTNNTGISPLRYLTVDTLGATVNFVSPTPANATYLYGYDYIEVSVLSDENLNNAVLNWVKEGESEDNFSMSGSNENWELNMTYLADGTYIFKVYANNTEGLWSVSETRHIYINTEGTTPTITFVYPTPHDKAVLSSNNSFLVKIQSSEALSDAYLNFDGNIVAMDGTGVNWNYTVFGISEGKYQYNVTGTSDTSALNGTSETRTIRYGSIFSEVFLYIGLLILLIVFLIGVVAIFFKFDNILTRVSMFGVAYLLVIAITFIGWQMASSFLESTSFLVGMLWIIFSVFMYGLFPVLIGAFAYYMIMITKIKEIQRLMDRGFSEDEAYERTKRRKK